MESVLWRHAFVVLCVILVQLAGCCSAGDGTVYSPNYAGYGPHSPGLLYNDMKQWDEKPAYACNPSVDATVAALPFCDTSLTIRARVNDLLNRLTVEEKIGQLVNDAPEISRLGIPKYQWWQEALHGVANSPGVAFGGKVPGATSFPQVILTAAAFNSTLWFNIAKAISTEGRAMYNLGRTGLTFWSPNINIYRDPRWGRGQETPGEDPLIVANYAWHFVKGLQGEELQDSPTNPQSIKGPAETATWGAVAGPNYLKASACCKHFTAYDLDNWRGVNRFHFDALVSAQDLEDTYQVPFKSCVEEGHASSLMCSYNEVNGIPTCADYNLLTNVAVDAWGLNGYIVSDCDAVSLIYDSYRWTSSPEEGIAASLQAGLDLDCGTYITDHGLSAFTSGKLNESTINRALGNLFATRMRLGLFDGDPEKLAYGTLGAESICTDDHQHLALEAARQGIVLLKNDNDVLPLSKSNIHTLALIGPHGEATDVMLGNYAGYPCKFVSPLQGLQAYTQVFVEKGCLDVACSDESRISSAASLAASQDVAVVIVGLDQGQETEGLDRVDLTLPGSQQKLVDSVAAAASSAGKNVVLVIMSGGPVDITFAKEDVRVQSILWVGYPGQSGGQALAEIIFGDQSPSGRLPVTWYPQSLADTVTMTDMAMRANATRGYPGRTYRFYTGRTVYGFGHGLGYMTNFAATFSSRTPSRLMLPSVRVSGVSSSGGNGVVHCSQLSESLKEGLSFEVGVSVANSGTRDGTYVALLYASPPSTAEGAPLKQLVGFERVHVPAGQTVKLVFPLEPCAHFGTVSPFGDRLLHTGWHNLFMDSATHTVSVGVTP